MTIAATRFGSPEYRKALRKQGRSVTITKRLLGYVLGERSDGRTLHSSKRRVNGAVPCHSTPSICFDAVNARYVVLP